MINPLTEIKKGVYNLLNNAVVYDSVTVPYYEGEGVVTEYQILLNQLSYTEQGTKHSFAGRVSARIEAVTEKPGEGNTKDADLIMNEVLGLLFPAPSQYGLTVSGFQVIGMTKNIQTEIKEQSGQGTTIVRRPLDVNFFINQINL